MATHRDLQRLKQEENTLMNIASKISDQLHRLQVEELSLRSHLNVKTEPTDNLMTEDAVSDKRKHKEPVDEDRLEKEFVNVDLSVPGRGFGLDDFDEEEEDEEDDEKYDQLIAYIDEITCEPQNGKSK